MKKLISLLLSSALCLALGGCYDSNEISRLAFVLAVGFDTDSYSFQIVKPSAFEGEGGEGSPFFTATVNAPNVYIAMDKLNSQISESCDYSHIKMVIFSEEKLKKGIDKETDAMLKSNDFHPTTRVCMCRGKAEDFMKDMKIPLDANPAEYYENIFKQGFTEYSPDVTLNDLIKSYNSHITGNVLPVINDETAGMAVVRDYRFSDTAKPTDAFIYNLLTQQGFEGNYPIGDTAVVRFKKKNCIKRVKLSEKTPLINLNTELEGNIIWAEDSVDKNRIGKIAEAEIKNDITEFLYRCSMEYRADILDFYKIARTHYPTVESWEKEDWQGLFEKSQYSVNVKAEIKREGLNIN